MYLTNQNFIGGVFMTIVRDAIMEDAERILEIYDYYVKNTVITFEYNTPSLEEFRKNIAESH